MRATNVTLHDTHSHRSNTGSQLERLPVWLPAVRFTTGNKHPALGLPGST